MPVPMEYWQASRDFERYLGDLKQVSLLATHNQCYAMSRAVLHVFRSHVAIADAVVFAGVLPPVLRAIFVEDWDCNVPVTPFPDRAALHAEIMAVRPDHNTATETPMADVARALRMNVDPQRLEDVLQRLPAPARDFWAV